MKKSGLLLKLKFSKIGVLMQKRLRRIKFFYPTTFTYTDYLYARPFNYYESPYPDIVEIHKKEKQIFTDDKEVLDIDFNIDRQFELIKMMQDINLPQWSVNKENSVYRYYYENKWFRKECAEALYYMLRIIKPKRIIEIGSGFSTAVMLDTNENYFNNQMEILSIEPRANRLKELLKPEDNLKIYEKDLQEVSLDFFDILDNDDILFIDSSHVSKINSDVNYLFFEILPRIKKNVYIHFHDMFYPFTYPSEWIYQGRAYNEMYLLRAFLMNNKQYSIQLFGDMLQKKCSDKIDIKLRGCGTGSIWIKKIN